MVIAFMPQKFNGLIDSNTNNPPQRFDESGGLPSGGTMDYENNADMKYEDFIDMDYES